MQRSEEVSRLLALSQASQTGRVSCLRKLGIGDQLQPGMFVAVRSWQSRASQFGGTNVAPLTLCHSE